MSEEGIVNYAFPTASDNPFSPKGMTLRDYFASKWISSAPSNPELAAKWCYDRADAMLKAREA
jgi:hypothetical protein